MEFFMDYCYPYILNRGRKRKSALKMKSALTNKVVGTLLWRDL